MIMFSLTDALLINVTLLVFYVITQPLVRTLQSGLPYALGSLDAQKTEGKFGARLSRLVRNQVEAIVMFAPLVFFVIGTEVAVPKVELIATAYVVSRIAYPVFVLAGVPVLRSFSFLIGWSATAALLLSVFYNG